MIIPATELQPGDQWVIDIGTVVIDGVSDPPPAESGFPRGIVLVHGRIVRGVGKGRGLRRWIMSPDQRLDIKRTPNRRSHD
jgi:hypothetical protein